MDPGAIFGVLGLGYWGMKMFGPSLRVLLGSASLTLAMVAGLAAPVSAQRAKDTMRAPIVDNLGAVSHYYTFAPENTFIADGAYDGLIYYDENTSGFEPLLAKSWKQVDELTYDIELYDDIKWQDGEKFDADDVVYFFNWLIAPETRLRYKPVFEWMKTIEKTGPYSVRITASRPTPSALMMLAFEQPLEPRHIHEKLETKSDMGWHPVGTGPFQLTRVDKFKGISAVRNEDYKHGGTWKPATNVKRWEFTAMPDRSTVLAQMIAGNLDVVRPDTVDDAKALTGTGQYEMQLSQALGFSFLMFDAAGRKDDSPFRDIRMRKAVAMAIDRSQIVTLSGAGPEINQPEAMCWRSMLSCDYSTSSPPYDPAAAKKLLAEAGHPDGMDMELLVLEGRTRQQAEAISGMLGKIGIRASVRPIVNAVYAKMQGAGELTMYLGIWSAAGVPDVARTMAQFFADGRINYNGDDQLADLTQKVNTTLDPAQRTAYAKTAFDLANSQAYVLPIVANAIPFVHTKDVYVEPNSFDAYGATMTRIHWKK